jgi:anti-sigma factor RsiW
VTHLADSTLALYAGKELSVVSRFRIAIHLRRCDRCRRHADEMRRTARWMHAQRNELPADVQWGDLAAEMTANIRLGLAAGRCVSVQPAETEAAPRFAWRNPALALPVLLLVIAGWILQSWHPPIQPPRSEFVLEASYSDSGIGVEKDGRGLSMPSPHTQNVLYSVQGSAAGVRYVDAESGQVTISHVYAQ